MRAAVFAGPGALELQDRPEPGAPGDDEILVEVEACGLCGSDVQAMAVPPGHPSAHGVILGHEIVGRVVATGSSPAEFGVGDRVVVDPDPSCGYCRLCRQGLPEVCENASPNGVYRDGGLARFCKVSARSAFRIDDSVPAPIASLAEPFACVVNGARRANVRPGEAAVVFGAGTIGCMFVALMRASGASPIVVVEPSPLRRDIARILGADVALAPDELAGQRDALLPFGADVVVDAVGSVMVEAIEVTATGGRVVLIGMNSRARAEIGQNELTRRSLTVIGSYVTHFTFPAAVSMLERGSPDLSPIITHVLPIDEVALGLQLLADGEAIKVVIALDAAAVP